jgi:hypothetical protein
MTTNQTLSITADLGCSATERKKETSLEVEVRVSREGDITAGHYRDSIRFYECPSEDALRVMLWRFTDDIFKESFKDYLRRKERRLETHTWLKDEPIQFHSTGPIIHVAGNKPARIDAREWESIARECTELFIPHTLLDASAFEMDVELETRLLVNSDGSEILESSRFYSMDISASAIAVQGDRRKMENTIEVGRQFYVRHPSDLPEQGAVIEATQELLSDLDALMDAPVQKPCDRPVLCDPEFSAQLLYTVLGEILVGRCSYLDHLEERGVKKGDLVLPGFISVVDLPGRKTFVQPDGKRICLNGHSRYDVQGVPARRIDLVRNGRVAGFPCTREYMGHLEIPNGHARFSDDRAVPSITNLFIRSGNAEEYDALIGRMLDECENRGYDYGFLLSGTLGSEFDLEESCFIVTPRMAYRVWARDYVDEDTGISFKRGDLQLVSDVQAVGNPKITLSYLESTGDDCTAVVPGVVERKFFTEPSSYYQGGDGCIISPSLYFSRMEIKKENYGKLRPLLLPHPLDDDSEGGGE